MRETTSKEFRDLFKVTYPGLDINITYWRFMCYLLFGKLDKKTNLPLIDCWHIAKAEYKLDSYFSKNYKAEDFLLLFQSDVMDEDTFSWAGWNYKTREAKVAYVKFPKHIELATQEERMKRTKGNVYFETGKKINATAEKVGRYLIQQEMATYIDTAIPEAQPLLHYMNELSVRPFTKVIKSNFNNAFNLALEIADPIKKRAQVELLITIQETLQPFYKPSSKGHTDRIFPGNESIPMLKREIRKELTKGWYEFDLANSQLALVARTWGITQVEDFLQAGGKIWKELFTFYGFDQATLKLSDVKKHDAIKDIFKTNLYSLIYGMLKTNVIKHVNEGFEELGIKGAGYKYFNHPLIKALYVAREAKLKELNQLNETTTIFGQTLKITEELTKKGTASRKRQECIRSIMAHQAQSLELYLLLPLVDLANSTDDFQITLWMHDGFSVNFTDITKKDYWTKRIESVVNERIKEVGAITYLEMSSL